MAHRAVGKARLIPALAFEEERHSLLKVPPYLPAPYLDHQRSTDQYGYVAVNGNYYWVPGTSQREVHALEYSDCLKIYHHRKLLVEYPLPAEEVKNAILSPAGQPRPRYRPRHRVRPTEEEQKALNAVGPDVQAYLRFLLAQKGIQTHAVIRQVHGLYQNTALPLFVKTIQRALKYRIADGRILERIAALQLREGEYHVPLVEVPRELHTREAYREGCATEEGSYPPPGLIGEEHG
jgi:hypothetical protein